jgi:hypothetical protein
MSRFPLVALSLAAMAFFAAVPVVHADLVMDDEVTKFNGTITDVGVVRGPFQTGGVEYRIRGEFNSPVDIDLRHSTFTIEEFFYERDGGPGKPGAGELMRQSQGGPFDSSPDPLLAPKKLDAVQGDSDDAKYETVRERPQIRAKVEKDEDDDGFKYKFDVRLDRGMMRDRPKLCPVLNPLPGDPPLTPDADGRFRTSIRVTFTIAELANPANQITVTTTNKWECPQPGRYHLRSR